MREKPRPKISRRLAERHESLFPKLQRLARQVQAKAGRSPALGVPDAVRSEAETLLFEVQPFRQNRLLRALPLAAPHYGALAGQLAEALAAMLAFEGRNTEWNAVTLEPQWMVPREIMKVRRLAPKPGSKAAARADAKAEQAKLRRAARMVEIRAELVNRLVQSKRTDRG